MFGPPPELSDAVERTDHVVSEDPHVVVRVHRPKGVEGALPCFYSIHGGGYVFGSWVLTGESRPYAGGNAGNVKPKDAWGAWELLLRYSELDLEDGLVQGGKEHDWTLGANWYLNDHFKFQANLIRAWSDKGNLALDPKIFEVRAQIHF